MGEQLNFAELPEKFLETLNEFTYGGFMLFYFDSKGIPHFETKFNEPIDAIALQKFGLDTLSAIQSLAKERIKEEISRRFGEEDGAPHDSDDDDEGDGEENPV